MRIAQRPLLIIKRPATATYRKVLAAVDFSDEARNAVLTALTIAPNARLTLVHVAYVPYEGRMREAGISDESIARCRFNVITVARKRLEHFISALDEPVRGLLGEFYADRLFLSSLDLPGATSPTLS